MRKLEFLKLSVHKTNRYQFINSPKRSWPETYQNLVDTAFFQVEQRSRIRLIEFPWHLSNPLNL